MTARTMLATLPLVRLAWQTSQRAPNQAELAREGDAATNGAPLPAPRAVREPVPRVNV